MNHTQHHARHVDDHPSAVLPASAPIGGDPAHQGAHPGHAGGPPALLNRLALSATVHCLTGCAIGEVLGMVVGTAFAWGDGATTALAVVLAFGFGYALTVLPLLRAGLAPGAAARLAFASDTASITIMEIVDNAIMFAIPGAMDAGLGEPRFWASLVASLAVAGAAAFPVNRWLIARGRGHAIVHSHHAPHHGHQHNH